MPADLLHRAITSVINQSFDDWELIIIEDGISKGILQVLESFQSNKIKYLKIEHRGVSYARNHGIENSNGKYVLFLDGDDEYLTNHLSSIYREIERTNKPVALFRTGMIHDFNNKLTKTGLYKAGSDKNIIKFLLSNLYGPITFCIARQIFSTVKFAEKAKYFEDTDFFIRALLKYPFYQIPAYTCIAHAHSNQSSHRMFFGPDAFENVENNINTIQLLFKNHRAALNQLLPANFEKQLISDKYLQHANGLLIARKIKPSVICIVRSIYHNQKFNNVGYYLKFFIKLPIRVLLKSRGPSSIPFP